MRASAWLPRFVTGMAIVLIAVLVVGLVLTIIVILRAR